MCSTRPMMLGLSDAESHLIDTAEWHSIAGDVLRPKRDHTKE